MVDFLLEVSAYDTVAVALVTLRYGTTGYSDPSAAGFYQPRLTQPFNFRRDMYGNGRISGQSQVSFGELLLANDDGGLDGLRDYGLAGQSVRLLIGDIEGPYSGFQAVIEGRMQQALPDLRKVSLQLRDRLIDLQKSIQQNKFLGTNVLPDGLEGIDDLLGKRKPLVYGSVANITPPCINTSRLIYQVNDGAVHEVSAVYDGAASLTHGADYTSQADMESNIPAASNYRVWKAGGYFRLGTSPVGAVTADVQEGASAPDSTAAQVAKRIITHAGGLVVGDISAADVAALDTANSAELGIYIDDDIQFLNALDLVLGSVGAWYGFDRLGVFRMQRLEAPAVSSVATFRKFGLGTDAAIGEFDIQDARFLRTNDEGKGVPAWSVSLTYAKNWTVQSGNGLAGVVTTPRRNFLKDETRSVKASDATVQTAYPIAVELKPDTYLVDQAAAQTEADRLLALFKVRRDYVEVDCDLSAELVATVDLGQTVNVVMPRFGYDAGRHMVVVGLDYNAAKTRLTLVLWG